VLARRAAPRPLCPACRLPCARRKQIIDASQASLSREKVLSTAQTADALVAVAALQGLDSGAALQVRPGCGTGGLGAAAALLCGVGAL
jgi:hypothetical protein